MRVISGQLKGKSINFLKSKKTRPLKDSVKENIFNIINHSNLINIEIKKSNVLDLYSGIGSFGIECISRGAKEITFVEKDKDVVKILNDNLTNLDIKDKANVINDKIQNFLTKRINKKFEIIFLDPPFAENSHTKDLDFIYEKKIFKPNHILIIHRENESRDNLESIIETIVIRKYGRSKIIFGKFLT